MMNTIGTTKMLKIKKLSRFLSSFKQLQGQATDNFSPVAHSNGNANHVKLGHFIDKHTVLPVCFTTLLD